MADKMEFPKTIEAFVGNYSFRDSDEVYTNGAELIPVFRVAQALEHYLPEIKSMAVNQFVEKVVADLEDLKFKRSDDSVYGTGVLNGYAEAIDVVKRGGAK